MTEEWDRKEAENKRKEQLREQLREETHPSRSWFHKFVLFISILVLLAGVNMALGQLAGMYFEENGPIQYVLRLYVVVLCALVIMIELEWTKFASESKILDYWVTRGLFYAFIGVIGIDQNDTSGDFEGSSASLKWIKAAAWIMVACGAIYFVMGICCLQMVYDKLRKDYGERLERAKQVRETAGRYSDMTP